MSGRKWLILQVCIVLALMLAGTLYYGALRAMETRMEALENDVSLQLVYIISLREIMIKHGVDVPPMPQLEEDDGR